MTGIAFGKPIIATSLPGFREALESYDQALALDPNYLPAHANRPMVLLNLCAWDRVAEADQGRSLSCRVTAVNSEGLASQISGNVLEIPGVGPENLEAPRVSGVGAVLP